MNVARVGSNEGRLQCFFVEELESIRPTSDIDGVENAFYQTSLMESSRESTEAGVLLCCTPCSARSLLPSRRSTLSALR
ncbi:Protein of unknown function [Gryllus bimaculatus]|nr:Protein of unknown function [Gryllus bimaculatus]